MNHTHLRRIERRTTMATIETADSSTFHFTPTITASHNFGIGFVKIIDCFLHQHHSVRQRLLFFYVDTHVFLKFITDHITYIHYTK